MDLEGHTGADGQRVVVDTILGWRLPLTEAEKAEEQCVPSSLDADSSLSARDPVTAGEFCNIMALAGLGIRQTAGLASNPAGLLWSAF